MPITPAQRSEDLSRPITLTSYALYGFADFSSIAIQIRDIGAPARCGDLARFGLRSMIAGLNACYLFATVAGGPIHSLIDRDVTNEFGFFFSIHFMKHQIRVPAKSRVSGASWP